MTPATSNFEIAGVAGMTSPMTVHDVQTADAADVLLFSASYPNNVSLMSRFWGIGMVPSLVLAAVFTSPIMLFDPEEAARRSGVYSAALRPGAPAAKRITLNQARLLALRVLAETEDGIRRDRLAEARIVASIWNEDRQL